MDSETARSFLQNVTERAEREPIAARREWLQRLAGNIRKFLLEFSVN